MNKEEYTVEQRVGEYGRLTLSWEPAEQKYFARWPDFTSRQDSCFGLGDTPEAATHALLVDTSLQAQGVARGQRDDNRVEVHSGLGVTLVMAVIFVLGFFTMCSTAKAEEVDTARLRLMYQMGQYSNQNYAIFFPERRAEFTARAETYETCLILLDLNIAASVAAAPVPPPAPAVVVAPAPTPTPTPVKVSTVVLQPSRVYRSQVVYVPTPTPTPTPTP